MARQNINIGSGSGAGDGESLFSAFDKVNDNFTELYNDVSQLETGDFSGDYNDLTNRPVLFSGSFADLTNKPTTLSGYGITDAYTKAEVDSEIADVTAGRFSFGITADDSTVRSVESGSTLQFNGGNSITTSSNADGDVTIALDDNIVVDMKGSVFADDSTLLVDGVNGAVPSANLSGALPAIAGDAITVDNLTIKQRINTLAVAMAVGLS